MLSVNYGGKMSKGKLHDEILAYLTEHGETGVNVLAKEFDVPLSTMQKYLTDQTYFKKTEKRKWDLPENVNADIKSDTMSLMVSSVENALLVIKSQLSDLQQSIDTSLIPVSTLKRGIDNLIAPVAGKSDNIHPKIVELDKNVKLMQAVFKKYVGVCPQEYQELIKNIDLYGLIMEMGTKFLNSGFNEDITSLFLEQTTELSSESIELLKEYQKGS
jgi:hypothetical protein